MKKKSETCILAGQADNLSGDEVINKGVAVSTDSMTRVRECHQRPRENGGPACLPVCRDDCPFYKLN